MKRYTYILLWALATIFLTTSCASQKPVVVTTHSDSVSVRRSDSVASIETERELSNLEKQLDSVSVEVWHTDVVRGDSVVAKKDSIVRIHTIYRDRYLGYQEYIHDTARVYINDTTYIYKEIPIEVPVVQTIEVEKKQSQFLRNSGIALWVILGILLLAVIAGVVLKFAK